ncbi:unnamed protein product [Diabrotica balteata]|uniref:Reverse transcriptase domain-containing protein n=1 Tax=Diabrotica balteata TaxID=107213 RepID=A0A9N9XC10_DIABA|nr:unnamed protein product [Diabrotica balteata]
MNSAEMGITINAKKTKYMLITKRPQNIHHLLTINSNVIEQVEKYQYLGTLINETNDHTAEINRRIEITRLAFIRMKPLLTCKNLNLEIKLRIID